MKRLLITLALATFLSPLVSKARADAEVSLDFFYDNLSPYGSWIDVSDYGYCFQPNVAVDNVDWRPYSDGYWAYTDVGWTWVSYEDFGWATYHYGRWANLDSYGWVWVPGYEWGPAWVSWRTGGDYIGWAPLPPQGETIYEGRPISGAVDVTFDIGPLYYNFVDIRYIGEPVLRQRIMPPARNITIINRTVNVTNITYSNSVVYNYGPNFSRLNQYSERPVPRLALKRETDVAANSVTPHGGNLNRVSNGQLMVVAPPVHKPQQKVVPKQVKATVAKPQIERGWKGINNRKQLQAEMKKENASSVPPPTFTPRPNYNGVMTSNGNGNWKQGEATVPARPPLQRTTPAPAAPARAAQGDSQAPRQEMNAAAGRPIVPGPEQRGNEQPRPGGQGVQPARSQADRSLDEAQPAPSPRRPAQRRAEPIEPSRPNDAQHRADQPPSRPRYPQQPAQQNAQPAQAVSPRQEQAQRPGGVGTSPEHPEGQRRPKKNQPPAEQTPTP
jgi:hypothetical protein